MESPAHLALKYYKLYSDVPDLSFATEQSACFDLRVYLREGLKYDVYARNGSFWSDTLKVRNFVLKAGYRYLLPTGIVFDIPAGYSVRIHPRSSLSGKYGIINPNLEGVVDSDYFQECKMLIANVSEMDYFIESGERILQAEMVPVLKYELTPSTSVPLRRTNRIGGFGSTGTV